MDGNEFYVFRERDRRDGIGFRKTFGVRRSEILGFERAPGGGTILYLAERKEAGGNFILVSEIAQATVLGSTRGIIVAEGFSAVSDLLGARRVSPIEVREFRRRGRVIEERETARSKFHEICEKWGKED